MVNENWEDEVASFINSHPDYCRTCEGWGRFFNPLDNMPEDCADCLSQGKCPWCRHAVRDGVCTNCLWTEGSWDGIPDEPESEALEEE